MPLPRCPKPVILPSNNSSTGGELLFERLDGAAAHVFGWW
ncbi:hypothetical protein NOC27_2849 [Nitrosococcus oceani AFC27]|nr:hypothetical protein NOC27_2849 [Nitrosococcus oceani AFC27]